MLFPPKAYIIGAQKAGTTTLAHLVGEHPEVLISQPKEPHFYSFNWNKGVEWYRSCFHEAQDQIFLDASTSYSMGKVTNTSTQMADDLVSSRIASLRPDARFIYVLRNPVERAYSAYWHRVRRGWEKRKFRDAVQVDHRYIAASCYVAQIRAFLNHFELDAFHFVNFRDLVDCPEEVTRECLRFLNIQADEYVPFLEKPKNQSFQYTAFGLFLRNILGDETRLASISTIAQRLIPKIGHQYFKRVLAKEIPKLSEEDRTVVVDLLGAANEDLRGLTGFDF